MQSPSVAAVSWGANRLDVFIVQMDITFPEPSHPRGIEIITLGIHHRAYDGTQWEAWEGLGGNFISVPAVTTWGPNRLDVFGIGTDKAVYHKAFQTGAGWDANWESLGGSATTAPVAIGSGNGRIDLFVLGTDNTIQYKAFVNNTWDANWTSLGGSCACPPLVCWSVGALDVFTLGFDQKLYHKAFQNWSEWQSNWDDFGGTIVEPPGMVPYGTDPINLFAVGINLTLWQAIYSGEVGPVTWNEFDANTLVNSSPTLVSWGPDRLDLFALSGHNSLLHRALIGTQWQANWEDLGGTFNGNPVAVAWGANRLDLFGRGLDNAIWHNSWDGSSWQAGWDSLGGIASSAAGLNTQSGGPVAWPPPGALNVMPSPGAYATAMWLMLDGSVLANPSGGTGLSKLVPDPQGNYATGNWSAVGNLLLQKTDYSSAVLSNGKLVTCGGEYSGPKLTQSETNFCEIYDPVTNTPTQFQAPTGWTNIGDGPTATRNDGTLVLGNTQGIGTQVALLNSSNLTWTFGGGDSDNEQGYVLMQTGDILTAKVYQQISMRYMTSVNAFVLDAGLPVMLGESSEIGPGIALMDGRVVWFGASGHTCIYTPSSGQTGTWVQGPDFPTLTNGDQLASADVPAILQPDGKVLVMTQGTQTPAVLVEFDPASSTFAVLGPSPAGSYPFSIGNPENARFLMAPNGHCLISFQPNSWYDLACAPSGSPSWAPTITSFPAIAARNSTVTLAGTQLCGLSECYGYDNQQAENYPSVRFVDALGGVHYMRAHDVSARSIAPNQAGTVLVDIPATFQPGKYSVFVAAMGIASASVSVTVT